MIKFVSKARQIRKSICNLLKFNDKFENGSNKLSYVKITSQIWNNSK